MMLDGAASIFPTLKARTWCILISSSGNLISSDRPVSIVFTVAAPPFLSPGFGLNHTEVTVPLSRHVLLRGVWKKQPRDPVQMTRRWVGHYNTLRAIQATRFLFSPTENFPWTDGKRSVRLGLQGMNEFFGSQSEDPVNGDFLGQ
jgi:hypothetical protein